VATFLAFVGVSVLVIVTPGQDTVLTIRNTLRGAGVPTALGVSVGQACWTLASSGGLAAVLIASETVFALVRLAGAAYLVYLGVTALVSAFRGHSETDERQGSRLSAGAGFRQGLVSNLGNPKMAVFFTSLLPQFGGGSFLALLALGLAFAAMTFLWLSLVAHAGGLLRRQRVRRVLDAATGVVLTALGLRLASERR
jgi:threonine/homoserine/homoserine lactone efflux protein